MNQSCKSFDGAESTIGMPDLKLPKMWDIGCTTVASDGCIRRINRVPSSAKGPIDARVGENGFSSSTTLVKSALMKSGIGFTRNLREALRFTIDRVLEGIVAEKKWGRYGEGCWKIRNPAYSQYGGRHEVFEK